MALNGKLGCTQHRVLVLLLLAVVPGLIFLLQKDAIIHAANTTLGTSATNTSARTRISSGIQKSLADDLNSRWLPSENVTFVLRHDMNATFLFVEDDPKRSIDPESSNVLSAEEDVPSLFHHLLFRPACQMREQLKQWGSSCAKRDVQREQLVIDVGCKRGYYSLMAASYGSPVYAFDPRPHCITLLNASVLANGFENLVTFSHAFVTDSSADKIEVRRSMGCSGTNDSDDGYAEAFGNPLDGLPVANETVTVGAISLDDMFNADRHDVLLLKMDVEGFESDVLHSATKLLERGAVRNIVLEFNVSMMERQEESVENTKHKSMQLVRQLTNDYGYKSKASYKGGWEMQAEMSIKEWETLLSKEENKFVTTNAWFYK